MNHQNHVVILPADDLDETFRLAAAHLAFRQGESFDLRVANEITSEWCAKQLARHLGWDIRSAHNFPADSLYDSGYHNALIHLDMDRRLLSKAMEIMSGRLINPEARIDLRYEFRSIFLKAHSPE